MNFTLAHEAYHWFAHRAYVDFHRLTGRSDDGTLRYSSSDILEIQANAMASRILMPREMFITKYREYRELSGCENITAELASFFRVSYTAADIRMKELGLKKQQPAEERTRITQGEAFDIYTVDENFRKLVDDGAVIFIGDRYVYNDPRYVESFWEEVPKYGQGGYRLTDYALSHPGEAFVSFRTERRHEPSHDVHSLYRESDKLLRASVKKLKEDFSDTAYEIKSHATRFNSWYEKEAGKHKSYCELARDFIDYRHGRMEDYDPKDPYN